MFNCDPLTCSRVAFVLWRLPYNNNPNSVVILRSATHYEIRLMRINSASCMFAPIGRPNVFVLCRVLFFFIAKHASTIVLMFMALISYGSVSHMLQFLDVRQRQCFGLFLRVSARGFTEISDMARVCGSILAPESGQ